MNPYTFAKHAYLWSKIVGARDAIYFSPQNVRRFVCGSQDLSDHYRSTEQWVLKAGPKPRAEKNKVSYKQLSSQSPSFI